MLKYPESRFEWMRRHTARLKREAAFRLSEAGRKAAEKTEDNKFQRRGPSLRAMRASR